MRLAVLLFVCLSAKAGTIKGMVLEYASGRPLARTTVHLEAVGGGSPQTLRSDRAGNFTFYIVPPGLYLVSATREGYLTAAHGQRLPTGRGVPMAVGADTNWSAPF
jgi:hypothetical protein